jgi:hypothetical protein
LYRTGPAAALICLALALASCGSGASSDAGTTASAPPESGTSAPPESTTTAAHDGCVRDSGRYAAKSANACGGGGPGGGDSAGACEARIGDFVDRMDDLRQSLLAGLSYAEYVVRVRAIRDAYEAIPVDKLGVDCLAGPAAKAEDAFNQYLRAANTWGKCAGTAGCAASEIEASLQRRWHFASKSLDAVARQS